MKKARFLALTSLCSILAGMPANAGKIKDSGAEKIGGVETKVNKESPNGTNKNEPKNKFDVEYINRMLKNPGFIKYAKWVLGLAIGEGTHELLSYFKGNPDQFYNKFARFSLVGICRNGNDDKINNKINKKDNTHKNGIDQMTKELLISDFRHYASYTLKSNEIVEELKKIFSEQEVNKLKEISEVKKQKMFGYDEYERDYHLFSSYHLKKIPEKVLESLLKLLSCKYAINNYKNELEFFVARESYDTTTFWLFCCPKSDQELCEKLENKFFQKQEKEPKLNPHFDDADSNDDFKKWCYGVYNNAQDAYNEQNKILKKYNDIELFNFNNSFIEELLKKNKNLDIVGEFYHWDRNYVPTDIRYCHKNLIKFDVD